MYSHIMSMTFAKCFPAQSVCENDLVQLSRPFERVVYSSSNGQYKQYEQHIDVNIIHIHTMCMTISGDSGTHD